MEEFIVYEFSPKDLCVSRRRGKILLLDMYINWSKRFGLVPGEKYILEDLVIRELEKCRIITGGRFTNVGYFPAEVNVFAGPYFYNDKVSFSASRVVKYKEVQVSSKKIEDLEFPALGELSEEKKELLGLLPQKNQEEVISFRSYMQWIEKESLTILEVGKDFEKKVGYKLLSYVDFIDEKSYSSFSSREYREPSFLKMRKSIYKEIFFEGKKGGEIEKKESLEFVKLNESGLEFSFKPRSFCPTGQIGELTVNGYTYPWQVGFPGENKGSYVEFAIANGWISNPPVLLQAQDMEWLDNGGKLAFSNYHYSYSIGGFDGDDDIWDCFPNGYTRQNEPPQNPEGWVSLYGTCGGHGYIFDPDFSDEKYIRKVEEAKIRTLAVQSLKANGKYNQYSHGAILGKYFLVEEVDSQIDFLYDYGWDYGYMSQSSHNMSQGIRFFEGVANGFDVRKSLEEVANEFKFVVPLDGSGIYLRIPKAHDLHGKVRFAGLIKRVREKLNELYPSRGMWSPGWDEKLLNPLVRDIEESNFNENDINTFEQKVLNLYQVHKNLVSSTNLLLEETLNNTFVEFVSEEIFEIDKSIGVSSEEAEGISIESLQKKFAEINEKISKLPEISKGKKFISDADLIKQKASLLIQAEQFGVSESLLDLFGGDLVRASQFMSNVAKIETWRLIEHELTAGRGRARSMCESAWSQMGETTDFFCSADPNDVKYYVYEHHFGENATPVVRREEKGNFNKSLSTSNDAMVEAFRLALEKKSKTTLATRVRHKM